MRNPAETIGELSVMKREITEPTLEELRGKRGHYAARLGEVAQKSFMHGALLSGTTIGGPSVLTYGRLHRLQTRRLKDFSMFVRNMTTPAGELVMFPLKTIAISEEGTPVIDVTALNGSYSVVHVPDVNGQRGQLYNPTDMRIDLAFSVDSDDLVTANGMNRVTADEYALFDGLVLEFERRVETVTPEDMAQARVASRYL